MAQDPRLAQTKLVLENVLKEEGSARNAALKRYRSSGKLCSMIRQTLKASRKTPSTYGKLTKKLVDVLE